MIINMLELKEKIDKLKKMLLEILPMLCKHSQLEVKLMIQMILELK